MSLSFARDIFFSLCKALGTQSVKYMTIFLQLFLIFVACFFGVTAMFIANVLLHFDFPGKVYNEPFAEFT